MNDLVLTPLLKVPNIDKIYVLRDKSELSIDNRVEYLTPNFNKGQLRQILKILLGYKACKKYKIDRIIGILIYPHGYIGRFLSLITGIPYVHMTIAGHREFWMHGSLMERINILLFRKSKAITVTGSETKKYLMAKGIGKDKVIILPNLPNSSFFDVELVDTRHYDIVSISRIDNNKNLQLLIRALAVLKNRFQLKVAIAGDGDQLENVKKLSVGIGVRDMIDFLGYIDNSEKIPLLKNSRVFVSCSKGEGFPVSLLEAMDCGCVPVVSNVGDIVDVVNDGYNGFVFDDTEKEDVLVKKLKVLFDDNSLYYLMRLRAYKTKDSFSIENNAKIWDSALN